MTFAAVITLRAQYWTTITNQKLKRLSLFENDKSIKLIGPILELLLIQYVNYQNIMYEQFVKQINLALTLTGKKWKQLRKRDFLYYIGRITIAKTLKQKKG